MNLSITLRNRRTYKEYAGLFMIKSGAWIMVALFLSSLGYIAYHGAGTLSPSFLSTFPEKMMEEGGILPCIIGTAILSVGAMAVALPLGIRLSLLCHRLRLRSQRHCRNIDVGCSYASDRYQYRS